MNMLAHLFLPKFSNNQRPRLLHIDALLVLALLFFGAGFVIPKIEVTHPRVLGIHIDVSTQDLLLLTNKERINVGLPPLVLSPKLQDAAAQKAADMIKFDYWNHFSPTGVSPWFFIKQSGYDYTYAGENLARGYNNAADAVNAWMASPDHRANILSKNYTEVGFAVTSGTLTGEKDTVLIVQMLGNTGKPPILVNSRDSIPTTVTSDSPSILGQSNVALIRNPLIDLGVFGKKGIYLILGMLLSVLIIDLLIARSRHLARIVGHNMDHILYLGSILFFVMFAISGSIN
jgi:hypothetical protein